jgi:sigma-E factor negative regulatory protein RseA
MREQINEKISLMVDDQLDCSQAYDLLKTIQHDPDLQAKLKRYQLISQAMKNDQCVTTRSDFVDKIHQQLRDEPAYLLPRKNQAIAWQKTVGLAVAASVALVAVIVFGTIEKQMQPLGGANTIAQHLPQNDQMNAQLNEYLQAHDNVWYGNSNVGGQQYARLVAYQQK